MVFANVCSPSCVSCRIGTAPTGGILVRWPRTTQRNSAAVPKTMRLDRSDGRVRPSRLSGPSAIPLGGTTPQQSARADAGRWRSARVGSLGWRVVRHWFNQTPSVRLAIAQARSLTVVPARTAQPEPVQGPLDDLLQLRQPLDMLVHAGPADLLAPQTVGHGAQPKGPEEGVCRSGLGAVLGSTGRLRREEGVDPGVGCRQSRPDRGTRSARSSRVRSAPTPSSRPGTPPGCRTDC